jgi:PAS domain S-box-containing protein
MNIANNNVFLQKEFTRKIIDSLPVSLYVVDMDLNIILWNRGRTIGEFGKKEEDVLGKNISEITERERLEAVKKEFIDVINSGKPISYERESPEPNRKERKIFRVTRTPIFEENNHVIAVLSIGEDITERRLLEQKLIDNDKLAGIGQLAAGVAHEINNPMAAISGCAEALIERFKDDEYRVITDYDDIIRYLKIIEDEIYRCKKITENLLTFARRGGKDIGHQKINAIIDDILNLLIYQQRFQSIRVVKEYDPTLPKVPANEGDLRQVFLIMILNAMDAMENGGELRIETYQNDNEVKIVFKDTGCGIPSEYINRIFDPFFTTKQPGKGTGLGLSIAYGIITQLKGRVDVESKEGIGTTFMITLPATM